MDYRQMYKRWMEFDENTRAELINIDEKEIEDRFYKDLEFGTGGLRGVIGAGTNRINIYTVRKATQGIANYINSMKLECPCVAIAYDSRRFSDVFAKEAGLVLNANGIKTYVYDELKPTPMLSYAVRRLNATAGIVITASHNPKEYNGYKVYWSDGGQITEKHAKGILDEINKVDYDDILTMDFEDAVFKELYKYVPEFVEADYFDEVKKQIVNRDIIESMGESLNIIYTPLHGTGYIPVTAILAQVGFKNVRVVPEQSMPDCEFHTAKYPNPEEPSVFKLAIEMAKKDSADLIIGTDPDCDRMGVVVKNNLGEYVVLTGNQTGALLTHYILSGFTKNKRMPKNPAVIKTVVTTELARRICEDFGVKIIDVLTGFKYIGEKIKEFEETGDYNFVFGFEESYGYLAGTHSRDKDGVVASMLICEAAAYYKSRGMSLYDGIVEIYEKYGYYLEDLKSITMKGIEGSKRIKEIVDAFRNNTPESIGNARVIRVKDYLKRIDYSVLEGKKANIELPSSNVMQLFLEDGSLITARPSGTEPKIKFYFAATGKSVEASKKRIIEIENEILKMAE